MILNSEYVKVSDLFEDAVKRIVQLKSLATVLQDAITSPDVSQESLYNTAWLLSDLLQEQHAAIAQLQDEHRKEYLKHQSR